MNSDATSDAIRSNVEHWKQLQDDDYFERHPCYKGLADLGDDTAAAIAPLVTLQPDMKVVVIGCGFGRESAHLAPHVGHIYGIDVNERILDKAVNYLSERSVQNFTPVLADHYKTQIPAGIDFVFSIVVMQHLTRDLVRDYFRSLGEKLAPDGVVLVQFLEELFEGVDRADAELRPYEPSISWTVAQIVQLASDTKLRFVEVRSYLVTPTALWHWARLAPAA